MQKISGSLTVYFDDPFWVGLYERTAGGRLEVCKITFGAEPKDYDVYGFLLENWRLLRFSPSVGANVKPYPHANPKRMARMVQKQLNGYKTSTKAQEALRLQREEHKLARGAKNRERKEEEQRLRFELKRQKRKEKHRGR